MATHLGSSPEDGTRQKPESESYAKPATVMLAPGAVAGNCNSAGLWALGPRARLRGVRAVAGACVRAQEANAGRTAAGATGAREVSVERAGVAVRRLGGGRAPLSWRSLLGSWVRAPKPRVPLTPLWSAPPRSCHALGSGLPSWSQLVLEARDKGPESLDYLGERPMRGRRNPSCPASGAVSLVGGQVVLAAEEKRRIRSANPWTCSRPGGRNTHSRQERACGPQGRRELHGGGMVRRLASGKGIGDLEGRRS